MKKTFSVNLGNQVYNIDEDAYLKLKEYLDRIEGYFSDQRERDDIMNDIELRISELFTSRMGVSKQVINLTDVEEVIAIMGDPREISGVEDNEPRYARDKRTGPRRIYRDPDDRIIGGVCSGLGAYLNIDPVILRVILVILFLAFGIGFFIYIILWIVVPEARTTAQKLEMRGDRVNATNIGRFFKDEFESVRKNFRRKNNKQENF